MFCAMAGLVVMRSSRLPEPDFGLGDPLNCPVPGRSDLEPELGTDCGGLQEWPLEQVVKALCLCHPDDDDETWKSQLAALARLFSAARRCRLETLLEIIPSKVGPIDDHSCAAAIDRIYSAGLFPDWWKLEPMRSDLAWQNTCSAISSRDPHCRGIVVLGLDAPQSELQECFLSAASQELVKGFAVGRTIFGKVARQWFAGKIDDARAIETMAGNFLSLCRAWDQAMTSAGRDPMHAEQVN